MDCTLKSFIILLVSDDGMESKRIGRLHGRLNACSYYISFTSVIASLTGHSRYSYNTPHSVQVRFMTSHKTKPDSRQPSQSLNRFFTLINIGKYTPAVPTSVPTRRTPRRVGEAIGRKVAPAQRQVLFSSPFVILTWTNPTVGQKNVHIYVSPVDFQEKIL